MTRRMYGSIVVSAILFLALCSVTLIHVKVSYGSAELPIYIRADGSVDPPTAPIQRDGDNYILTNDLFIHGTVTYRNDTEWTSGYGGPALCIERSNMILNGAGHQICFTHPGNSFYPGIHLDGISNVTIINVTISQFQHCIDISNCSNITLTGNVLNSAGGTNEPYPWTTWGIRLDGSSNNTIIDNDLDTAIAFGSLASSDNHIFHNNFWEYPLGMNFNWNVSASGHNFWDDGHPSGGNFWGAHSAYTYSTYGWRTGYFKGIDVLRGPYQNETGSDGIVDTSFSLGEGNVDHYPLLLPRFTSRISPQAQFRVVSQQPCYVSEPVVFDSTVSTPGWNGSQVMLIKEFNWDFGDGNVTSIPYPTAMVYPTHTYTFPGQFNATLTIIDAEGINASESETVQVMMPVFVSISTSLASSPSGYKVDVTGKLYDVYQNSLENQIVVFRYTFAGSDGWIPITSGVTDHLGGYHIVWMPTATGNFTIEAEWSGNETHFGTSKNVTVMLGSTSPPFFETLLGKLAVYGTSIAVVIAVIAFYVTRKKRKVRAYNQNAKH